MEHHTLHSILGNPSNSGGRSMNASSAERGVLLGVIGTHLGVLDARDNDSRTLQQKFNLWDQVTREFNLKSGILRSKHQIQTLYKNMKAKSKKYQSRIIETVMSHVPGPEYDPISEMLIRLLEEQRHNKRLMLKEATANAIETGQNRFTYAAAFGDRMDAVSADVKSDMSNSACDEVHAQDYSHYPDSDSDEDKISVTDINTDINSPLPSNTNYNRVKEEAPSYQDSFEVAHQNSTVYAATDLLRPRKRKLDHQSSDVARKLFRRYASTSSLPGTESFSAASSLPSIGDGNARPYQGTPSPFARVCCSAMHEELLRMAREEHHMTKEILCEERLMKEKEHDERMEILSLEKAYCKEKLRSLLSNSKTDISPEGP